MDIANLEIRNENLERRGEGGEMSLCEVRMISGMMRGFS